MRGVGSRACTRAVLPVMRHQRSGHIISISSAAGLTAGYDFVTAYAASKFGLEGWMESLQAEVVRWSIRCEETNETAVYERFRRATNITICTGNQIQNRSPTTTIAFATRRIGCGRCTRRLSAVPPGSVHQLGHIVRTIAEA